MVSDEGSPCRVHLATKRSSLEGPFQNIYRDIETFSASVLIISQVLQVSFVIESNDVVVHNCLKDVSVQLHYQIYDGIPLIEKWLTLYSEGPEQRLISPHCLIDMAGII